MIQGPGVFSFGQDNSTNKACLETVSSAADFQFKLFQSDSLVFLGEGSGRKVVVRFVCCINELLRVRPCLIRACYETFD